jgi:hypothetical protein
MDDAHDGPRRAPKGTGSWTRTAILIAGDGVELVRHANGRCEVRRCSGPIESLSSAFDVLATLGFWA